jgi:hypothetical protein
MTVSGESLTDRFREIPVVCQYEQGLGNLQPEGTLRLRQCFTESVNERADVNPIAGQETDHLGSGGIAFGQAELKHPGNKLRLFLPSAGQGTEVRTATRDRVGVTECVSAKFRPC